ncbi:hypothetical protein TKK_0015879 [Trichogramma kaykai]
MEIYNSRYLRINKFFLKLCGLWPEQSINSLIINFGSRMEIAIENLAHILYFVAVLLKLIVTMVAEKELMNLYVALEKNWIKIKDPKEKEILYEYSENGRRLTLGYIAGMLLAGNFFVSLPLSPILMNFVLPRNESRQPDFLRRGEFPVADMRDHYLEIFAFDASSSFLTLMVLAGVDSMYVVCVEHCIGLFVILKSRLRETIPFAVSKAQNKRDKFAYKMVVDSIKLHKIIIHFAQTLEFTYSTSFLLLIGMKVIFCSMVCVLILLRIDEPHLFIQFSAVLGAMLLNLFYVSWPGQKMIDYSTGLFDDAWMNHWYESSRETQQLLQIMRMRCLKPCYLTAGNLYVMNFENFAKIIKTSMSYITVVGSIT